MTIIKMTMIIVVMKNINNGSSSGLGASIPPPPSLKVWKVRGIVSLDAYLKQQVMPHTIPKGRVGVDRWVWTGTTDGSFSVAPFTLALWGSNRCIAPWHPFGPLMPQLKSLPLVGHPLEGKKKTLFRSPATVTSRREMTVWFGIDRHNNKILKNQFFSFENIQRFEFP